MQWEEITNSIKPLEEEFNKSLKCVSQKRTIKEETLNKHINILIDTFNTIRAILYRYYNVYTNQHKNQADEIFLKLRDKLVKTFHTYNIKIKVPLSLTREVNKLMTETDDSDQEEIRIKADELTKFQNKSKMDITKFIDLTSKILPEFDGRFENLQKFLDALTLLDSIQESHEQLAIQLIHTKISGNTRTRINGLNTIAEIINKLKADIKGESPDIIISKLMATRQSGKANTQYAQEIENLCKSLNAAYLADGLSEETATKYVVQAAVKSVVKNVSSDRTKLIVEAGTFANVEQVVTKLLNAQTEQTSANLLYFSPQQSHGYRRRFQGRYRGNRYSNNRNQNNYRTYNNNYNNNGYTNNRSPSNDNNRYHNNNGNNNRNNQNNNNTRNNFRRTNSNRNVHYINSTEQENYGDPSIAHLGEN